MENSSSLSLYIYIYKGCHLTELSALLSTDRVRSARISLALIPRCISNRKGCLRVTRDYSWPIYIYIYI